MRHLVALYGLRVSSPVPLPAPTVTEEGATPDVVVHFGVGPPGADRWPSSVGEVVHETENRINGVPMLVADRPIATMLRLRYAEGIQFHVARGGHEVWAEWHPPLTTADAISFLLGPVMGAVLREFSVMVLHASALVLDGRAWAFVGAGGSGKSTLAAAGASAGLAVLTEDVLALRPSAAGWSASPAYDQIRLWDSGAGLVTAPGEELPPLTPSWPKRAFNLASRGLASSSVPSPLGGIFVLHSRAAPGTPSVVEPLGAAEALADLVAHGYVNYLLDPSAQGRELMALAALVRAVPVRRLVAGTGRVGLQETISLLRSVTL